MKYIAPVLEIIALFTGLFATAQSDLVVKNGDKGLYIDHKVAAKEGLYSIGRAYNVHPKYLAAYNKLDVNKGLNLGQTLHIPLSDTNFTQKSAGGTPVYYVVGDKEGLMKVSTAANKVSLQKIRDWNNLNSDNVSAGKKLIVGYLTSKDAPVAIATTPEHKADPAVKEVETPPIVKKEPVKEAVKEPVKETVPEKKEPFVVQEKPLAETPKEEPKKEEPKKADPPKAETATVKEEIKVSAEDGYFKTFFAQQTKATPATHNETVTAGIFKTSSGWQDGKYYILIDNVPTGTIVRVINPDNNKAVYAKVLGEMSGIKQNQGLNIRISNAAASALGVSDTEKFIVKANY